MEIDFPYFAFFFPCPNFAFFQCFSALKKGVEIPFFPSRYKKRGTGRYTVLDRFTRKTRFSVSDVTVFSEMRGVVVTLVAFIFFLCRMMLIQEESIVG